jgi:hypothetical protein
MKSVQEKTDSPAGAVTMGPPEEATASGIRPAQEGAQPIKDLTSFLELLPDFGENVAEFSEAIAESRVLRRAAAEAQEC